MPLDDQASTSAQATETANESMYSTAEAGLNSDEEDALVGDGNSGDDGGGGGGDDEAAIEDAYSVLLRTIRTQLQRIEFKFLIPEAHFRNVFYLFLIVVLSLALRAILRSWLIILVCILRLSHYVESARFNTAGGFQNAWILLRIIPRNLIAFYIYDHTPFLDVLQFRPVQSENFLYTLFIVCMANTIVLDGALIINILLCLRPCFGPLHLKQAIKVLEYIMSLYCACVPPLQWRAYINNDWVTAPYFIVKMLVICTIVDRIVRLLRQCFQIHHIGVRPTREELDSRMCTICREDVEKGIKLSCGDIFDEECIRNWLDHETWCPNCKRNVATSYVSYQASQLFPPHLF